MVSRQLNSRTDWLRGRQDGIADGRSRGRVVKKTIRLTGTLNIDHVAVLSIMDLTLAMEEGSEPGKPRATENDMWAVSN
jgi:hypothetical protein